MFADFVGYTRLTESQIVDYVKHFMGSVRRLVDSSPNSPLFSNTWGDGIFMVFRDVRDAGLFALDLCDLVHRMDWKGIGFREDQSLRIALHAGPVQQCEDPVTGGSGYFGSHIGRTARIEPITEPGQVYTSEQFAALAECYGIEGFRCDYVGRLPLSKGYGAFPTYHLRRSGG
jgi:class 3 adenylate cyclase